MPFESMPHGIKNRKKGRILVKGRNCWRRVKTDRFAFLIDGASYFSAVADAIAHARSSVLIAGWDLDTRVRLRCDGQRPEKLGAILEDAVRRHRKLRIHVLPWDFAMLFALERQPLPLFGAVWLSHRRISLRHDGEHPHGASHHQKIVVVDDRVAFAGGLDLTGHRWDTPEHLDGDSRRKNPMGVPYGPFHDLQVAVEGEAAAALGDLVRARWQRATGQRLKPPPSHGHPLWPHNLEPDLEQVHVGIARTVPAHRGTGEVREVEQLHLDAIKAARRWIYIENQYLTAPRIGDAIAARLAEKDGPEVVVILPSDSSGWLEQSTMDVLRTRLLRCVREADRHDRMRVLSPVVPGSDGPVPVYVHAKVMVVDDIFARVGSANLSNRSMGLDTECDVALDADEDVTAEKAIGGFRNRLLAEHLGVSPARVAELLASTGSLVGTIDLLKGGSRTLRPLTAEAPAWLMEALPDRQLVDPERPIDFEHWVKENLPRWLQREVEVNLLLISAYSALCAALVVVWFNTSFGGWVLGILPESSGWSLCVVLGAYILGSALFVPVTLLTLVTVLVHGVWLGSLFAFAGMLINAVVGYLIGRRLRRDTVRWLAGTRLNRVSRRLAPKGFFAVLTARLLPIASFGLVSFIAGSTRIRLGDYALGTLVGMLPGLIAVAALGDRLGAALRNPTVSNVSLLALLFAGFAVAALVVAARLGAPFRRHRSVPGEGE